MKNTLFFTLAICLCAPTGFFSSTIGFSSEISTEVYCQSVSVLTTEETTEDSSIPESKYLIRIQMAQAESAAKIAEIYELSKSAPRLVHRVRVLKVENPEPTLHGTPIVYQGNEFELAIYTIYPVSEEGAYRSLLKAALPNNELNLEMYCRIY